MPKRSWRLVMPLGLAGLLLAAGPAGAGGGGSVATLFLSVAPELIAACLLVPLVAAAIEAAVYHQRLESTWPQALATAVVGNGLGLYLAWSLWALRTTYPPAVHLAMVLLVAVTVKLPVVGIVNVGYEDQGRLFRVAVQAQLASTVAAGLLLAVWGSVIAVLSTVVTGR